MNINLDVSLFYKGHILIIGDLMLDQYLWGDVKRISPEAPVPVFHIRKRSEVSGGAGNVVNNLIGLGCKVSVVGVRGKDEAGSRLKQLLSNKRINDLIIQRPEQPTITKTRVISNGQQLLRLDDEEILPLSSNLHKKILNIVRERLKDVHAIIFSDYGKGVLQTPGLAQDVISLAGQAGTPVFVDPKGSDWTRYRNATCVTPNTHELEVVTGQSINDNGQLIDAMHKVMNDYKLAWLLVTQGAKGMCLMSRGGKPLFIPAQAREVYDVSGAGDTVISSLALGVAAGYEFAEAAQIANLAAGVVVGKLGTQPVNLFELKASFGFSEDLKNGNYIKKVTSLSAASVQVEAWKANGGKVVFTNGCFDLLHPGHIQLLNHSKELGDRLVVGLNADTSVRRLKGSSRPILNEQDRASILGSLDCVDLVVLFEEDTPENLIRTLKPDVLVKGADYQINEVVGREIVESYGGLVRTVQLLEGYSTTNIARKLMNSDRSENPSDE